jgi:hypothetical protein
MYAISNKCVFVSIYMFANVIVSNFVDQGFIIQDFWSSKQVEHFVIKDLYYEQVLMTNCILDSWQDRLQVRNRLNASFDILHSFHHHCSRILSQKSIKWQWRIVVL